MNKQVNPNKIKCHHGNRRSSLKLPNSEFDIDFEMPDEL